MDYLNEKVDFNIPLTL